MGRERSMVGTSSGRAAVMGHAGPMTAGMKPTDQPGGADPHLLVLTGDIDVTSERQLQVRLREQITAFGPELMLDLSQVFVGPFEGILRTHALQSSGSILDLDAIVALIGWTVLELIVVWIINIFRREPV